MADWTEAEDKMLAYLTKAGMSARQIATHFPGRSKNSIIGRQHRIGLKVKSVRAVPSSMPLKPPRDHRTCINVAKLNKLRAEMQEAVKAQPEPKKAKQMQDDTGAPVPLMIPLLDLTDKMCRWVVTDDSPFLFCAHEKERGSPYCRFHQHVSTHGMPKQKLREAA